MKVSIIAPTSGLEQYASRSDHYHLTLSHLVLCDPDYRRFYERRSVEGDWIILDNSAHEFGGGMSTTDLLVAAAAIQASEIVLPDRLFFGDDTYENSKNAFYECKKALPEISLMGVPQGRTPEEYDLCAFNLIKLGVDTIGVSKDYEVWEGGLMRRVQLIRSWSESVQIHLLGWGRDLRQLYYLSQEPDLRIRGVDSAKPLVFASKGILLPDPEKEIDSPIYPKRPTDFFSSDSLFPPTALHNIEMFKKFAGSEGN